MNNPIIQISTEQNVYTATVITPLIFQTNKFIFIVKSFFFLSNFAKSKYRMRDNVSDMIHFNSLIMY